MTSWLEEQNCENLSQSQYIVKFLYENHFQNMLWANVKAISWCYWFYFRSWVSLVSKNYEIERAIVQLENEVAQMKQQQGDENKENIRQDF